MKQPKHEQPDPEDSELESEYERMRELLQSHISDFAEQHDVPVGLLSLVLLEVAVMSRMTDYVLSVEKPSASGLKLDIDRMRRDLDDFVRHCKRNADGFIRHMTEELREAEREIETAARPQGKKPGKPKR